MMKPTLLFDYGGTLDTSATHWYYVFKAAYDQCLPQISLTDDDLRKAYVTGERALAAAPIVMANDNFYIMLTKKIAQQVSYLVASIEKFSAFNTSNLNSLIEDLATYCNEFAKKETVKSARVLEELRNRGYKCIIVSNFYGNLHAVLNDYNLSSFFETVIESSVVKVRKPNPTIWQLGVNAAQCEANCCIAIGDSYSKDIVPASSIGCQTIWFEGKEWEDKQYDRTVPTHIITNLSQLLSILL